MSHETVYVILFMGVGGAVGVNLSNVGFKLGATNWQTGSAATELSPSSFVI